MLRLTVQSPILILHLLPDNLKFDWIVENQITEFGSDEEPQKRGQVVSSERLAIKNFDLIVKSYV